MTTFLTWEEFDQSVEYIANKCRHLKLSGVYGIPRGGLCLAVALSHKLKIKLNKKPIKNSLIVDDVYETGHKLSSFRNIQGSIFFVLFSKKEPTWWHSVSSSPENDWIVFPWEDKKVFLEDKMEYIKKRSSN